MNILTFIQRHQNARKIFGQRELKIIEKQLLGINLTQSEKNRLSRDIRPKFAFIKEAARFEDEFKFKKGAIVKERINKIKEAILSDELYPRIKKIILYGSVAENYITFRSDIDLAVIFDTIEVSEATRFRIRALGKSPEKADIQVYNILSGKIKKEIDIKGRMIYERKD
ncbi:MAG TPA: nucleotidyltransferase domain-containing protein [Candidatus Nanoarchaeia archaeon]|nr:nucleotidyltransferase domain-containing protein [Candidatus Nanoarchaeia archaeon]